METDIREQCPCLKFCKECNDLKKLIHLKNNKETYVKKSNQKEADDVFISHNIKDVNITSVNFLPEHEKHYISCPRCRKIIEFTTILLQKTPTIDEKSLLGVCSHCVKERRYQSSCYECENNVKKFVTEYERKEGNKETRRWLSKIRNLLQNAKSDADKSSILKSNARSDTYQTNSNQVTKIKKKPLSETSKPETIEDSLKGESVINSRKLLNLKNNMPIEKFKELRRNFKSRSLHDLRKLKTDNTLFDHDYTVIKRNREYMEKTDTPVILFEQFKKDVEGRPNADSSDPKKMLLTDNKIYLKKDPPVQASDRFTSRDTIQDIFEFYTEQKLHVEFPESTNRKDTRKILKAKKYSQSLLQNRKYHSEEALVTSGLQATKESLDKDFRYSFPEEKIIKREPKCVKSSMELILDTQNMLLARAEEKRKNEEKYRQEQELKKIDREEEMRLEKEKAKKERNQEEAEQKPEVNLQKYEEKAKSLTREKQVINRKVKENKSNNKYKSKHGDEIEKHNLEPKHTKNKEVLTTDKEIKYNRKEEEKHTREKQIGIRKEEKEKEKLKRVKETGREKEIEEKRDVSLQREKEGDFRKSIGRKNVEQQKKKDDNQTRNKSIEQKKAKSGDENYIIKEQNKGKGDIATDHFKKALLELAKEKQEAQTMKKKQEERDRKTREVTDNKEKEIADLHLTSKKQAKSKIKLEPEKDKVVPQKKPGTTTTKDVDINKIKVQMPSTSDLILNLVQIKKSDVKRENHKITRLSELNITPLCIKEHQKHKTARVSTCLLCINSDMELDVESILLKKKQTERLTDIIIGPKIFKYKPPLIEKTQEISAVPILFQTALNEEVSITKESENIEFFKNKTVKTPAKQGKINFLEPPGNVCSIEIPNDSI